MPSNQDISNNAFSKNYQNKIFFYFVLVFAVLLIVLKLPMAGIYYDTVSTLITFAPMIVILVMAGISFWKGRQYPDYQPVIRKFYLTFTLKFLTAILIFYIFYSPSLFSAPLLALYLYLKTLLTLEGFYFLSSYLLTIVISLAVIFVAFRAYQKTKGTYDGSIQLLVKKTLYGVFALSFFIFVSSAAAYPSAYKPLTDTLGDTLYTLSSGSLKFFKGSDQASYAKIDSLGILASRLSRSISQTSTNLTQNKEDFKINLDSAKSDLASSLTKSSQDLTDKIKEDLTGKLDSVGGTLDGSLTIKGDNADLTVEGLTTTRDIIPNDTLSYNLGKSGRSWNELYIHRLLGASPVFIGDGESNQGLTNDGDLVVSHSLEVQGTLFASGYAFPGTDGSAGQVLQTDGAGILSWVDVGGSGIPGGLDGQIQFNDGGVLGGGAGLLWNSTSSILSVDGKIGIGESSPGAALSVSGGVAIGSDYDTDSVGDGNLIVSGYVGVGTTNPQRKLQIHSGTADDHLALSGSAPGVNLWSGETFNDSAYVALFGLATDAGHYITSSQAGDFTIRADSGDILFGASNLEQMRIKTSNGYVGIGTSSPAEKLDVNGRLHLAEVSAPDDTTDRLYNVGGNLFWNGTELTGSVSSQWTTNVNDIYYNLGNVGIGTTDPQAELDISQTSPEIRLTNSADGKYAKLLLNSSNDLTLYNRSTPSEDSAVQFDGSNRIATANNIFSASDFSGGLSIAAWVKSSGTSQDLVNIEGAYYLYINGDGTFGFEVSASGDPLHSTTVADGNWHYVVGTADASANIKIYVDGVLEGSKNDGSYYNIDGLNKPTALGAHPDAGGGFVGTIDEAVIWNKLLSQGEITARYDGGAGYYETPTANLIALWHLDENTGTNAADMSGNGFDGTLASAPLWAIGKVASSGVGFGAQIFSNTASLTQFGDGTLATRINGLTQSFYAGDTEAMSIDGSGNLGLGDTTPDTTLKVVGSICAKSDGDACFGNTAGNIYATNFIVDGATHLPDYVFEPEYPLMPLADLKSYLDFNKHLPGVPGASEVAENGLNLSQMVPALLEKTEENTLYILQNNDQLTGLALKTDNSITTLQGLQASVDEQLGVVGKGINDLQDDVAIITKRQDTLLSDGQARDKQISSINDQITKQDNIIATLQAQILELQTKLNTETNLAQIDLNTQDATFIKLLLGTDRVTNPEDVDILGKLSSKTLATGGIEIVLTDPLAPTIGTAVIKAGEKSVEVETTAVADSSKIFVTVRKAGEAIPVMIGEVVKGKSFVIETNEILADDAELDWWIVEAN